ncbi:transcriptional regulator [Arthrobacter livingstonensis]|uniref:Transcriptional regulator n=2 Tax=Arthrobacter livingstonensis TaxID=670078 RepID=A0A2V5L495_9MICC|nr:transcriptional regulator [Arthrobacter livingstonensis]
MNDADLKELLDSLLAAGESEVVEFKRAGGNYDTDKIGEYFSALANEANLRSVDAAWLVFGVDDRTRKVVGTDYREDPARLDSLKLQINQNTDPRVSFRQIHVLSHVAGRVVLFEIPPAPRGFPIAWKGDYRARAGESLTPLGLAKQDEIRNQTMATDWTAEIISGATRDHLDPAALARARQGFAERNPRLADQIISWDDATFLAKARLTLDGHITRATLLLLGRHDAAHLLSPHMAEMTWKLTGEESAYEHFATPFLLTGTLLLQRIRNLQIRFNPPNELIYREIEKYNESGLHEALYNCIAHQDYRQYSRVIVTEYVDRVEFISVGEFYDQSPEAYMLRERVPRRYRNPFLVAAMTELNLIDHMGNGIHRIVDQQRKRFLPLPDYELGVPGEVKLTVYGAAIDEAYSKLLMAREDLPLEDVLALDRVQKHLPISAEATARLRKAKLIEGRKPHLRVAAAVADAAGTRAEYIRTRGQDDTFYIKQVRDYLEKFGAASRAEIDGLLASQLSAALDDGQKRNKVGNLLGKMRDAGTIRNEGTRARPRWVLS